MFNTGSEAVENAVKYAREATKRPAVVVFDHAFHGRSLLTMTMTAKNQPYKHGFGPFAPEVYRAPMAYPYRWPSGPQNCAAEAFSFFTQLVDAQIGADAVACVVVEPIQGEGGFIVPPPASSPWSPTSAASAGSCSSQTRYRPASPAPERGSPVTTKVWCRTFSSPPKVWRADATGRGHRARRHHGCCHPGGIGGTYSGNPVACAAALGVFEEIETHDLLRRAQEIGALMVRELGDIAAHNGVLGEVRGRGAMIAAELVVPAPASPTATRWPRSAAIASTTAC